MAKTVVRFIGDVDEHLFGYYLRVLLEYIEVDKEGEQDNLFPETINIVEASEKFIETMRGVKDTTSYTFQVDFESDKINRIIRELGVRENISNKLSLIKAIDSTFGETTLILSLLNKKVEDQIVITKRDNGLKKLKQLGYKVVVLGVGEKETLKETLDFMYQQIKTQNFK